MYGDPKFLEDLFGPLVKIEEIKGKNILDIGSGTGRIVEMLLRKTFCQPTDRIIKQ